VDELGASLRRGVITLDEQDVRDATTAQTLAITRAGVDRDELLAQIRRYRDRQIELGVPGWIRPEGEAVLPDLDRRTLGESFAALLSGDRARVALALGRRPVEPVLTALVVRRLAD